MWFPLRFHPATELRISLLCNTFAIDAVSLFSISGFRAGIYSSLPLCCVLSDRLLPRKMAHRFPSPVICPQFRPFFLLDFVVLLSCLTSPPSLSLSLLRSSLKQIAGLCGVFFYVPALVDFRGDFSILTSPFVLGFPWFNV